MMLLPLFIRFLPFLVLLSIAKMKCEKCKQIQIYQSDEHIQSEEKNVHLELLRSLAGERKKERKKRPALTVE